MSQSQMNEQALAALTRRVERAGQEFDDASKERAAAVISHAAAAVQIAEAVRAGVTPTAGAVARYEEAIADLGDARQTARVKHQRYEQLAERLYQEMEKPPAVAPAEGDETNNPDQ